MSLQYPSPKYPSVREISSREIEERLFQRVINPPEEELALRLSDPMQKEGRYRFPIYDITPGEKVLVVAATEHDFEVVSAYTDGLRKKGAKVDLMLLDLGKPLERAEDIASQELDAMVVGLDNPIYTKYCNIISGGAVRALVQANNYKTVLAGSAGPLPPNVPVKWKRMLFTCAEEVSSEFIEFPLELQMAIDKVVYGQINKIHRARLTDPEGTDITWTNYDDHRIFNMSHEYGKPVNVGYGNNSDCQGVVAGTLNHMGAFPKIIAHVKGELVTKVEGGGRYGDAWREKLENLNKIELPKLPLTESYSTEEFRLPGPGFFWHHELAIGTLPKIFRLKREAMFKNFANFLHDRLRSGYVHHGFGPPIGVNPSKSSVEQVLTDANLPWAHVHIHNMFATLEGRTEDGDVVKIIDRGHLTALDDPTVRSVASKYGNANKLLGEAWVPAVPGINAPGDYFRDYAINPEQWIRQESEKLP